jgi:hypothetical protein
MQAGFPQGFCPILAKTANANLTANVRLFTALPNLDRSLSYYYIKNLVGSMDIRSDLDRRLRFDHPTDDQMAAINKFKPYGQGDYDQREVLSVPILASTNMMRWDLTAWTQRALQSMSATFPGQSLITDHDWENVGSSLGFVYDSEIIKIPGSDATKEALLDISVNSDVDSSIFDKQGFLGVVAYAAIPSESSAAGAIRYRQLADVSTGGMFLGRKYICPLCGGDFGEDDPHYPPGYYSQSLVQSGKISSEDVAPFAWVDGWHQSHELSFVTVGNVPQATIFTEELIKLIWL